MPEEIATIQLLQSILVAYIVALFIFAVGGFVIAVMFYKVLNQIKMYVKITADEARKAAINTGALKDRDKNRSVDL